MSRFLERPPLSPAEVPTAQGEHVTIVVVENHRLPHGTDYQLFGVSCHLKNV